MVTLRVNGATHEVDADPRTPLLWVLRDILELRGTKYGCGIGQCGTCTIHLDGNPTRACMLPVGGLEGSDITTIEGLSTAGDHPVQRAWKQHGVPQCGYCQTGQIMSAAALLNEHPTPTDEQIDTAMAGNLCRCGTYTRIRAAIHSAAEEEDK